MLNVDVSVARKAAGLPMRPSNDAEPTAVVVVLVVVVMTAASACASTPDTLGVDMADVTVAKVLCNSSTAGLSVDELPLSGTATSLDPHITMRMGKSLGQLLTNNAVLTALALGGDGGGKVWNPAGEVDTRRNCVLKPCCGGDEGSGGQYEDP